jgi:hypothetical protein
LSAVNQINFTDDGAYTQELVADYENKAFKIVQGTTEKTIATVDQIPTELGVMDVDGFKAIEVSGEANKIVSLKLDDTGNVVLSQGTSGLKAEIDLSAYQTKDTKYGIEYDSKDKVIKLVEGGSKSEISAAAFVKDGMLQSVSVDNAANTITFA